MLFSLLGSGQSWSEKLLTILLISVALLIALPFHEFAHAYIAFKMGDTSQKANGRMTMNPLKHLDLMGTICILLTGFGWAKPVYVNTTLFNRGGKYAYLWVSAAGPLSNLLMGFVFSIPLVLSDNYISTMVQSGYAYNAACVARLIFQYVFIININLAVLNLIPVPPFDGYGIVSAFLPDKAKNFFHMHQRMIGLVFLVLLVTGFLTTPIWNISSAIQDGILKVVELVL